MMIAPPFGGAARRTLRRRALRATVRIRTMMSQSSALLSAGRDDVFEQVTRTTETEVNITDSWEQMIIGLFLRGVVASRPALDVLSEVLFRLFVSYSTHFVVATLVHCAHTCITSCITSNDAASTLFRALLN